MIDKEVEMARLIKEITGVNVFDNSRKRECVEYRALYNYILNKVMGKSLSWIRDNYRCQGKDYDHATVIHSLKMFDVYKRYNDSFLPIFNQLCQTRNTILERIAFIDTALKNMSEPDVSKVADLVNELINQNLVYEAAKNIEVQAELVEA